MITGYTGCIGAGFCQTPSVAFFFKRTSCCSMTVNSTLYRADRSARTRPVWGGRVFFSSTRRREREKQQMLCVSSVVFNSETHTGGTGARLGVFCCWIRAPANALVTVTRNARRSPSRQKPKGLCCHLRDGSRRECDAAVKAAATID